MPMRPVEVEPLPPGAAVQPRPRSRTPAPTPPPIDWRASVSDEYAARVAAIAAEVRLRAPSTGHAVYLALSGALLSLHVPPEELPALVRTIANAAGDRDPRDRELAARTTVGRKLTGQRVRGLRQLREQWPAVASAVEKAFAVAELPEPPRENVSAQKAAQELEQAIRSPPDGLSVIAASCGLGKTRAAEKVAVERARRDGSRWVRTAISVPTHKLALEIYDRLSTEGILVRRYFGPLSCLNALGQPECRFHALASALVRGRQSMQWELCLGRGKKPCPYKLECRACGGAEGPSDARITIGPHQLVGELDAAAGTTGLLVIDEPPPLIVTDILTAEDLEEARIMGHFFGRRYAVAMRPAMRALQAWIAGEADLDDVYSAEHALRRASEFASYFPLEIDRALDETETDCTGDTGEDVLRCVRAAHYPDHKGTAPPLQRDVVERLRFDIPRAKQLSKASRTAFIVHHALTSEAAVTIRVIEKDGTRMALVTRENELMQRALNRAGSVIVTDANAELHLDAMRRMVGYDPPLRAFDAHDGASIKRTHVRTLGATRRSWLAHGRLVPEAGFVGAVRAAVDWIIEGPRAKVGIVTMRVLEVALAAALGRDIGNLWAELEQTNEALSIVKHELGSVFARLDGTDLVLGHYGAIRGLNSMRDVDAIVTLGDPWPNMDDACNTGGFLGLGDAWEARYRAMARAELEQAQGRLRAIHRQQPGRALHIGALLPSGSAWSSNVEVRELAERVGRPANAAAMTVEEVARIVELLGGVRATARALRCGKSTVGRYLSGEIAVPHPVAIELRRLAIGNSGTGPCHRTEKESAIGVSGTPNNANVGFSPHAERGEQEAVQYQQDGSQLGAIDYVPDIPRNKKRSYNEGYLGQPPIAPSSQPPEDG